MNINIGDRTFKIGDIVRHYKHNLLSEEEKKTNKYLFRIEDIAYDDTHGQYVVIYRALYSPFNLYTRWIEDFVSRIDKELAESSGQMYRFEVVESHNDINLVWGNNNEY